MLLFSNYMCVARFYSDTLPQKSLSQHIVGAAQRIQLFSIKQTLGFAKIVKPCSSSHYFFGFEKYLSWKYLMNYDFKIFKKCFSNMVNIDRSYINSLWCLSWLGLLWQNDLHWMAHNQQIYFTKSCVVCSPRSTC